MSEGQSDRSAAVELAKALRQLVNAPLPPDLELERPYWVACRRARAILSVYEPVTGIDGEQDELDGWQPKRMPS